MKFRNPFKSPKPAKPALLRNNERNSIRKPNFTRNDHYSKYDTYHLQAEQTNNERTTYNRTFSSSQVSNQSPENIIGNFSGRRIQPDIPFLRMREYYETIGRVQNVVDSMVDNVINREWFFDDTTDGGQGGGYKAELEMLENWKDNDVDTRDLMGNIIRNWLIFGVMIVSTADWQLLQMESLISKRRDDFGNTLEYIQSINGHDNILNANDYFEVPFINMDRKPWGTGLFSSVMNVNWVDVDGEFPTSALEWYRQTIQDYGRIQHRYGSPRLIYAATGEQVNQETIDNEIAPMLEGMKPGDRAVINGEIVMVSEAVDGQSRFTEYGKKVQEEVDTGLQSSANRLITEPSAMADAREAGENDDDRILGVMAKIEIVFNKIIIPAITGDKSGHLKFAWGSKNKFDLHFPDALEKALTLGVMTADQARRYLEEQQHWKIPELIAENEPDIPENPNVPKDPNQPDNDNDTNKIKAVEQKIAKEKFLLMEKINKEIDSL